MTVDAMAGPESGAAVVAACHRAGMQVTTVATVPPVIRVTCPGCGEVSWLPVETGADRLPARHLLRFVDDHRGHGPPPPRRHRFALLVEPVPTATQVAEVYRRLADVGITTSPADGVGRLGFERIAASLSSAVMGAVADVEAVSLRPVRVDQDDPECDLEMDTVLEAVNSALLLRALLRHTPQSKVIAELATNP